MTTDPDPFEAGQNAARKNIPAEANPYRDGSEEHSLWAAGHEQIAGHLPDHHSDDLRLFRRPAVQRRQAALVVARLRARLDARRSFGRFRRTGRRRGRPA